MLDFFTPKKRFHHQNWIKQVLAHPHHQWIRENRTLLASFRYLLEKIPPTVAQDLAKRGELLFLTSNGRWAASYVHHGMAIILYPEVLSLLKRADPAIGLAILAHELGHLVHRHHEKNIDVIQAQVEADDFALKLGFGEALSEFFEKCPRSEEILIRTTYVTSKLFSRKFN